MVQCKAQTAPSGQRQCLQKGGYILYKQAKYTLEKEIRVAKRNYSGKLRSKFSSSHSASVWKGMKDITSYKTPSPSTVENQKLADDLNEFYCRFEKNTIHTSCNPPLPHTCTADKRRWRAPGLQKEQKKESTRSRRCVTSLPKNLCWPAGPHLHTDLQQITGAVRSPLMLQMLHHHPRPKETQNYWT